MYITQQQEQFSLAYIHAVATVAGYSIYEPKVDDDSVDIGILANSQQHRRAPRIEIQAKCHKADEWKTDKDTYSYPLKLKNYNDLRCDTMVPRILVVLMVPQDTSLWMQLTHDALTICRCAYWFSLKDFEEVPNEESVTVRLLRSQMFNCETLQELMNRVGETRSL